MRFWGAILSIFGVVVATDVRTDLSPEGVETFSQDVSTGTVADVERALMNFPELATRSGKWGFQAIHVLDYIDFDEKLALLLRYGADINAQNDEGHALIHILIDEAFLPAILAVGADIELRDNEGRTPLMIHLNEPDNYDMIEALLKNGANPNAVDDRGSTPLEYARQGEQDVVDLLIRTGAK